MPGQHAQGRFSEVLALGGPWRALAQLGQRVWRQLLGSEPWGSCSGGLVGKVMGIPGLGVPQLLRGLWLYQAEPGDAAAECEQQNGLGTGWSLPPRVLWDLRNNPVKQKIQGERVGRKTDLMFP